MADNKGVWLDKDTGKVTTSKPSRGRQLVAPGREATNAEKATIERFKESAGGGGDVDKTVTTATVSKPSK